MTHHTDAELLPCPFCGAKAHFEIDDDHWEWIECGSCGMQGNRSASLMEDCKPKLAEAWNCRAPAAPVQQGWQLVPIVSTFEMDEAGMHPDNESPPAIYRAMLAAAPSHQSQRKPPFQTEPCKIRSRPKNTRDGAPYDDPEFEKLAREHAVWGTAQSALCAQFWLAALAQRAPLTKEEISEIMKLVDKYGTAVEANSTGNPSDYTLALEEARAFDAVRFRLLTIERTGRTEAQGNSQQT